jgi:rhodanese-related sulfurtransferase
MENVGSFIGNHWLLVTLFVVLATLILSDALTRKISGVNPVGTAEAIQIVNQRNGLFLDIRDSAEFKKEYIAESMNLPLSSLETNIAKLKDTTQPIILICASGQRSSTAAKQLRSSGFSDISVLSGGLNAWKDAKLPLFS